jgi:hypothetical protein
LKTNLLENALLKVHKDLLNLGINTITLDLIPMDLIRIHMDFIRIHMDLIMGMGHILMDLIIRIHMDLIPLAILVLCHILLLKVHNMVLLLLDSLTHLHLPLDMDLSLIRHLHLLILVALPRFHHLHLGSHLHYMAILIVPLRLMALVPILE